MQWVKDVALLLRHLRSLLWCWFHPCPRNFHMLSTLPKKKRKSMGKVCRFMIIHHIFLDQRFSPSAAHWNHVASSGPTPHTLISLVWGQLAHWECKSGYFWLFRAIPEAYGGSQTRGQIGAVATGLHHSHSYARSKPYL